MIPRHLVREEAVFLDAEGLGPPRPVYAARGEHARQKPGPPHRRGTYTIPRYAGVTFRVGGAAKRCTRWTDLSRSVHCSGNSSPGVSARQDGPAILPEHG